MLVKMRSNLYVNDTRYRASPGGTEIPDKIDGKQVVEWAPKDKRKENLYYLPQDVKIIDKDYRAPDPESLPAVNPTQSPPPGPTPTEGTNVDLVDDASTENVEGHLGKEPVSLSELNKAAAPKSGDPKTLSELNKNNPDPLSSKKLK